MKNKQNNRLKFIFLIIIVSAIVYIFQNYMVDIYIQLKIFYQHRLEGMELDSGGMHIGNNIKSIWIILIMQTIHIILYWKYAMRWD